MHWQVVWLPTIFPGSSLPDSLSYSTVLVCGTQKGQWVGLGPKVGRWYPLELDQIPGFRGRWQV